MVGVKAVVYWWKS